MTPILKEPRRWSYMSIVSHMGGLFVPPTPYPHRPPAGSLHPPIDRANAAITRRCFAIWGYPGNFQGGRFVLDADAGPVCAVHTKRGDSWIPLRSRRLWRL